mgnify:CR=1 FL=1
MRNEPHRFRIEWLADEVVLIGGHLDHLGTGHDSGHRLASNLDAVGEVLGEDRGNLGNHRVGLPHGDGQPADRFFHGEQ